MKLFRFVPLTRIVSPRVMNITLAFLVFFTIVLNSFVPRNFGNKETIVQIISAVTQSFVVKAAKSCTDNLMALSNRMIEDLRIFLRMTETGATTPVSNGSQDNETPANTASDAGIIIQGGDITERIKAYIDESSPIIVSGKVYEQLYKLYCNLKICGEVRNNIGIVEFVLFILVIERRKFWDKAVRAVIRITKGKANLY